MSTTADPTVRSFAGVVGSNPTRGMDVFLCVLCVVR